MDSQLNFDARLQAFLMTEVCGVLQAYADKRSAEEEAAERERLELEAIVNEFEMEQARSKYGEWA